MTTQAKPVISVPLTLLHKRRNGTTTVYKRHEELGRGGFAAVYRVTEESTGASYALKAVSRERVAKPKTLEKLKGEIAIQRTLDHPNILKSYDDFDDLNNFYIVLELCPGRSIRDKIRQKRRLTEPETRSILNEILAGLCYLHDNQIIHRDLKPENFLVGSDGRIKIADFGLCAKLDHDDERKFTVCGTPNYLSPELLTSAKQGHSYEVDIWTVGICAFAMLTGHPPFETAKTKLTYEHIKNCKYTFPADIRLSDTARDFIERILQINPEKRPSAQELSLHPFISLDGGAKVPDLPDREAPVLKPRPPCPVPDREVPALKPRPPCPVPEREVPIVKPRPPCPVPDRELPVTKSRPSAPVPDREVPAAKLRPSCPLPDRGLAPKPVPEVPRRLTAPDPPPRPRDENVPLTEKATEKETQPIPVPTHYVARFCDHSDKYGLGYMLMDGTIGACFNDLTRMVMDPHETFVQYWETYQTVTPEVMNPKSGSQQKKLALLRRFSESLKKTKSMFDLPAHHYIETIPMKHVKYWMRNDQATLFRLDDRNIQVNFTDRCKLIIFWNDKKMMMVRNMRETASLVPFPGVSRQGPINEERRRFNVAKDMLAEMSGR
jgi:polo-like kinase 1